MPLPRSLLGVVVAVVVVVLSSTLGIAQLPMTSVSGKSFWPKARQTACGKIRWVGPTSLLPTSPQSPLSLSSSSSSSSLLLLSIARHKHNHQHRQSDIRLFQHNHRQESLCGSPKQGFIQELQTKHLSQTESIGSGSRSSASKPQCLHCCHRGRFVL